MSSSILAIVESCKKPSEMFIGFSGPGADCGLPCLTLKSFAGYFCILPWTQKAVFTMRMMLGGRMAE